MPKKQFTSGKGGQNRAARLIEIGIALSAETNFDRLMEKILLEAKDLANADGGTLYLRQKEERRHEEAGDTDDTRRHKLRRMDASRRIGDERRLESVRRVEEERRSEENRRQAEERRVPDDRRGGDDRRDLEHRRIMGDRLEFAIIRNDSLNIAMGGTSEKKISFPPLALYDEESGEPNHANVATHVALTGEISNIIDAYEEKEFDFSGTRKFDEGTGYRSKSFLTVPLKNYSGEVIGVLQLINAKDAEGVTIAFDDEVEPLIQALTSQAAVALDNQQLIEAQKKLLESFIELMAAAIDAKSPYTGGHCQRVPELTLMMAEAARDSDEASFKDFDPNEEELYELHIAAWLHDCGKVTTPEYVVDKATKLETIYNRMHEIRTRFEVLKRDAEIACLKAQLAGKEDKKKLESQLKKEIAALDEDYAFIAECNVGGEFLDEDKVARIKEVGARGWTRTLDNRLGLSQEEERRLADIPHEALPVAETLLADRSDHIIPWGGDDVPASEDEGFRMEVPAQKFNLGEIYNLCISRGTLTDEDRYKINDHIVQTIRMLNRLPFPRHMKRVPEYAGAHHETMVGTGYPKKLGREDMSLPARMMAIADIFEALTARDRPYKKAKTLSEAIKIMGFMDKDQHIDPELFRLFLKSGVYKVYAEQFLHPSQLDEVDITPYL